MNEVLFEFRITPNSSGDAPFKILFGINISIPCDWPGNFSRYNYEPVINNLIDTFTTVNKQQNNFNLEPKYAAGDKVLIKNLNRSSHQSPWIGPYTVLNVLGPVTIDIEDFGTVHVNKCKKYFQ